MKPMRPLGLQNSPHVGEWVRVDPGGDVTLFTGRVELGQGALTGLVQIAAEELNLPPERVRLVSGRTDETPNELLTAGSMSIELGGAAVRLACAYAMSLLAEAARRRLGTDAVPSGDGRIGDVPYHELAEDVDWSQTVPDDVATKDPARYTVVGQPLPRVDLTAAMTGAHFVHDLELPEMLHARVIRPPGLRATLRALDDRGVASLPGVVRVVRDGSFVAVLAEREEQALAAAAAARDAAEWDVEEVMAPAASTADLLAQFPSSLHDAQEIAVQEDAPASVRTLRARYTRPFLAHASIGPSCAVALLDGPKLTVWSHTQGPFPLRATLARALDLDTDAVTVIHVPGAGCYGHNGADDVAYDAALLARAVPGRPVRVVWSRAEELTWSPLGSAMAVEIEAALGANGSIASWEIDVTSGTHIARPGLVEGFPFASAGLLAEPLPPGSQVEPVAPGGAGDRNIVAIYDFPVHRTRYHLVRLPFRTSALRALGAYANVFAIESMMDELAEEAEVHPVEFRLRHLADERAAEVVRAAAELAGWPGRWQAEGADSGIGIGFARYKNTAAYAAVVAEVEAVERVRVTRVRCAIDAGLVINPDGLANQVEGGIVQAISWTLKEQATFDAAGVSSGDWERYPILGFEDVPDIEIRLIDRRDHRPLGAGEALQGPTAAAIANAVRDALGVRVRDLPLTPEAIVHAHDTAAQAVVPH